MGTFLLIRHGDNDTVGRGIAGRTPGVHLNARGREQAEALADRLQCIPIRMVFSSPLERARETAAPLASRLGIDVGIREGLIEMNFGDWSGRSFADLQTMPKWKEFNHIRSCTRIPGGEILAEVQARMVAEIEQMREEYPDVAIAIVSHGDPIKTVLAHYLGISLDFVLRLDVSIASVSIITINDHGPKVLCVNNTGALPAL